MATLYRNRGAAAAAVVIAKADARVYAITCENENAAARYFQLHDATAAVSAGAVPVLSFLVPATSQITVGTDFFTDKGYRFTNGVVFAFSTTNDTYTAGTATEQSCAVHYAE